MVRTGVARYPAAVDTSSLARDVTALRISLAHATRRGLGMTLASCVYWAGLACVYALGIATVLVAAAVQWWLPRAANVAIPLAMLACYALASLGVWRGNRASGMHAC